MKKYIKPKIEIIEFSKEKLVTASSGPSGSNIEEAKQGLGTNHYSITSYGDLYKNKYRLQ